MRLFVAINVQPEEKRRLFEATAPLRDAGLPVRWVEPESYHVTLKFLGWVRPEMLEAVAETMAEAAAGTQPFTLPIGGLGAFPTLRRPRVIWVGAKATPALRCLKHDLEWKFAPLGFEREVRAFQPHLTLGRARKEASAGHFRDFEGMVETLSYETTIDVAQVDLMRSHLSPKGARYERIATAPLGGVHQAS